MIKEHEGHPAQEHKKNDHPVEIRIVIMPYALVLRGISGCGHGSEGMTQGIKEAHSSEH